jgi:hypothetical protein
MTVICSHLFKSNADGLQWVMYPSFTYQEMYLMTFIASTWLPSSNSLAFASWLLFSSVFWNSFYKDGQDN